MRIAICDDEEIILEIIKEKCITILNESSIEYDIALFNNGIELLKKLENLDIIFLDINMPEIDGFSVAELLRKEGYDKYIIFLTSKIEYMQRAFKVKAFRYLLKPIDDNQLKEALNEVIKELFCKTKIILEHKNGQAILDIKELIYIESLGDNTAIYMTNEYYISNKPLKYWVNQLKNFFYQTHKSYLVNLSYVKRIEDNFAILKNNIKIPISYRKSNNFKVTMKNYIVKNAK
ncbi:LytTR family DNA-binding domain-containing protein [Anaerocolumna aminovalerica]|uniref:Stage 0 sporulation protein A homolog n=1 Tax=Anaerocolumna aminovalerica TaxID=1527 RepID=A0A1I5J1G5_9FIRM|nr:LytTR family DNA-binding domain-containing protein [Anaerocolumna aminovalerica]MDU6266556.1 LytTR family DNA-binding domain-containing protein [Anaerocolumna aminovalerica]SFO66473.1 DNA-binding response regulator, LytR/AlgR family [Anaerocolumna aminovalerica]